MVYVAVLTGLRISELAGLRWNDVHEESITIDERFCRGDLGYPKVTRLQRDGCCLPQVVQRIHRLKGLTVKIGGGRRRRDGSKNHQTFKVVKSDAPDALVFQSVRKGVPMRDNNILSRHIKPAAKKLGIPWVNPQGSP
jgi:integrase